MREPAAHAAASRSGETNVKMEPGTAPREHVRARPAAGGAPPSYGASQPGHAIRDSIPGNCAGLAGGASYAGTVRHTGMGNTRDAGGAGDKARQDYPLAESGGEYQGGGYEPAPAHAQEYPHPHQHQHQHQHQSQLHPYQPHHHYQPDRGFSAEADSSTPAPPGGSSSRDRSSSPDGDGSVRSSP